MFQPPPEGYILRIAGSPWREDEAEQFVSAMCNLVQREGSWRVYKLQELIDLASQGYPFMAKGARIGAATVIRAGDVDWLSYEGEAYVVPLASLGEKIVASVLTIDTPLPPPK